MEFYVIILVILIALAFEYINGFHDTANAIATVVGTKVLTPRQAIILAAGTNLLGAFTGVAVAKTIAGGLVNAEFVTQGVLICALLAGIFWNLLTWWFGMPSSSTHALVGGLVGATVAAGVMLQGAGKLQTKDGKTLDSPWGVVIWNETKDDVKKKLVTPSPEVLAATQGQELKNGSHKIKVGDKDVTVVSFEGQIKQVEETKKPGAKKEGLLNKVIIPMISSPICGFLIGLIVMSLLYVLVRFMRPIWINRIFGKMQIASSAYMGFSHGMNDATKTMGIITLALVSGVDKGIISSDSWLFVAKSGDPFHLPPMGHFLSMLPDWLHFGWMPDPVDTKNPSIPAWVVIICALTMAAGTAAGGWKIIKTMGHKMVKLQPIHGFAAETTAATVLYVAGSMGMPVSTTHAITTSIMGVGCAKRFSALKLKVVERIIWAWIMTLPATAGVAFGLVWLASKLGIMSLG